MNALLDVYVRQVRDGAVTISLEEVREIFGEIHKARTLPIGSRAYCQCCEKPKHRIIQALGLQVCPNCIQRAHADSNPQSQDASQGKGGGE